MLATVINALAVLAGSIIGLVLRKGIQERYQKIIFTAAGLTSLTIGVQMAMKSSHMLAFAIALIVGGLLGTLLNVEGAVLEFGERLKRRFAKKIRRFDLRRRLPQRLRAVLLGRHGPLSALSRPAPKATIQSF